MPANLPLDVRVAARSLPRRPALTAAVVAGLGVGLALAATAGRVLQSLLLETTPLDPLALAAASGLLAFVALVSCWLPARGAARIGPLSALRSD